MVDLSELTDKDLYTIGEGVLAELNINLFNAVPTIHKAYQIYVELVHAGYSNQNKQLACEKIKQYFRTRTFRNQRQEFQVFFGIPFKDEMRPFLALSFRTCEIDPETVRKISFKTNKMLCDLEAYKSLRIDETLLTQAISELYRPKYHENEWRITIPALFGKIKKLLVERGECHSIDSLEETFYQIDPNPKKKKRPGLKLVKGDPDNKIIEIGTEDKSPKRHIDHQQVFLTGGMGPVSEFEETLLTKANVIKESELTYVRAILELLNGAEVPDNLNLDLYQNDDRHPLITNFISSVKSYNHIMSGREMNLKEAFANLKVVVRGLREMGGEVERGYRDVVGGRVRDLQSEIKKAG